MATKRFTFMVETSTFRDTDDGPEEIGQPTIREVTAPNVSSASSREWWQKTMHSRFSESRWEPGHGPLIDGEMVRLYGDGVYQRIVIAWL